MTVAEGPAAAELAELEAFALDLVHAAGRLALPYFRSGGEVRDKAANGSFDPVTAADRAVERAIREGISARYPSHGILGEEEAARPGSGRLAWTVDPIDGTRAFLTGLLHWGVLLALTFDGVPVLGVVHQPYTGETWCGRRGGTVFRHAGETRAVRARSCSELALAHLASTDPHLFTTAEAEAFDALRARVRLTRYGTDCYAYCMLAAGRIDLVVESGLSAWDVQALMPVVEGAGGRITSWTGGDCSGGGRVLAAGDARLHEQALALLAVPSRQEDP